MSAPVTAIEVVAARRGRRPGATGIDRAGQGVPAGHVALRNLAPPITDPLLTAPAGAPRPRCASPAALRPTPCPIRSHHCRLHQIASPRPRKVCARTDNVPDNDHTVSTAPLLLQQRGSAGHFAYPCRLTEHRRRQPGAIRVDARRRAGHVPQRQGRVAARTPPGLRLRRARRQPLPLSPAMASHFTLSSDTTLTIAAGQTTSTGTVTITPADNTTDDDNRQVTVSAR